MEKELTEIDVDENIDYIFERLIQKGIAVKREDIDTILEMHCEFMESKGVLVRD
jgi:hypothetical protein